MWMTRSNIPEHDRQWLAPFFVDLAKALGTQFSRDEIELDMATVIENVGKRTILQHGIVPDEGSIRGYVSNAFQGPRIDVGLAALLGGVAFPRRPKSRTQEEMKDFEMMRLRTAHAEDLNRLAVLRSQARPGGGELLAKAAESFAGRFRWMPSGAGNYQKKDEGEERNDFAKWLMGGGLEPAGKKARMNCWEAVFFSAYKAGLVTKERLMDIHRTALKQLEGNGLTGPMRYTSSLMEALGGRTAVALVPQLALIPRRGDIVFFAEENHIAICVNPNAPDGIRVMGLWKHPRDGFRSNSLTELAGIQGKREFGPCPF